MRAGIQNDLVFRDFPGFPFDFAQGGEPVEPRVSPQIVGLARNDRYLELRRSLFIKASGSENPRVGEETGTCPKDTGVPFQT